MTKLSPSDFFSLAKKMVYTRKQLQHDVQQWKTNECAHCPSHTIVIIIWRATIKANIDDKTWHQPNLINALDFGFCFTFYNVLYFLLWKRKKIECNVFQ